MCLTVAFELYISLQAGTPCLLETCPGLHCLHLWSWTQILLHAERNKLCPYARSLLFQVDILPD